MFFQWIFTDTVKMCARHLTHSFPNKIETLGTEVCLNVSLLVCINGINVSFLSIQRKIELIFENSYFFQTESINFNANV